MKVVRIWAVVALAAIAASPLMAQDTAKAKTVATAKTKKSKKRAKEDLQAQVKVSKADAEKTALSKVAAGSTIKSSELEREKGTVVWSFDINVPGKSGVEEILVSAIDGSVVSQQHESAAKEKSEMKKEKAEKKKSAEKKG